MESFLVVLKLFGFFVLGFILARYQRYFDEYHGVEPEVCEIRVRCIDSVTEYYFDGDGVARYVIRCIVSYPGCAPVEMIGYQPWHVISRMNTNQVFRVSFRRGRETKKPRIVAIRFA